MKPQTHPLKPSAKKALILVALIAGMCHLFGPTAHANGLIPAEIWLTFDYKTAQPIHLEGIQLVRCPTSNCEQPALLQQYGTCSVDGCLSSSPELPKLEDWMGEFECAGNRCRAASYGYPYEGPYFKLVVQFSDQARTSEVMNGLPLFPGDRTTWRVIVQDTDLSMTPDTDFKELNWRYGQYRLGLVLTQLIELLVAGLYLLMVVRVGSERLVNRLIMIFLINLATFPVVWFLFPAFSQFQFTGMRLMGIFGLIVATLYALALVRIYTGKGKARTGTIVLAVSSLPLTLVCMVFMLFATYFGHANVSAVGLPPEIAILASEIVAVVSEAALIYILSRKSLSLRHAGAMSLLMNAASFFFCLAAVGV